MKKALWILIYSILGLLNPHYLLSHDFDDKVPTNYASFQSPARNAAYVAISTGEYRSRAHRSQLKGARLRIRYEGFTQEKWLGYLRHVCANDQSFLENAEWYAYDNFVAVVKAHRDYPSFVATHYQTYKKYEHKNGWFDSKKKHRLAQRFAQLYKEIKIQEQAGAEKKRTQKFYDNYPRLNEFFIDELNVQHDHAFFFSSAQHERWERRNSAFQEMQTQGISYTSCEYQLSSACSRKLREAGADSELYQRWYGNQLQQVIHRDCVALAHEVAALSPSSSLYDHRGALIDWIDAAREFNQDGECAQACTIQDLCFSLLEYGTAIVEGAVAGVRGAAEDLIEHPLNTAACIIIPEGVLVYQLSKVLVNVADIGLTYACDKKKGRRKLDDYIAPLTATLEAIQNKQVSGPDVVRAATQFAVGWKAQSKLLAGLGKFYGTSKVKLERFIKENPLAETQQYLTTPEGLVLKASTENHLKDLDKISLTGNRGLQKNFDFTETTVGHMRNPARFIPVQILRDIIDFPMHIIKDPRGATNACMYYSQLWKNGKLYNAEVLYDEITNKILHFKYDQRALGPLGRVK